MTPISLAAYLGIYNTLAKWWNSDTLDLNTYFCSENWTPGWWAWISSYKGYRSAQTLSWSLVTLACVHNETKIVRFLLDRGGQVTTSNDHEVPPIVAAAIMDSGEAARELIQHGATMCSRFTNRNGHLLLHAIQHNSLKVLKLMRERFSVEPSEMAEILAALQCDNLGSADAITTLLDMGAEVNMPLEDGTLLWVAARERWEDVFRRLVTGGADVNARSYGVDALELSVRHPCDVWIPRLLIEHGARVSGMAVWSVYEWEERDQRQDRVLPLLRKHNPDLNETWTCDTGSNTTALIEAVYTNDIDDVRWLLANGADANLRVHGDYGSALDAAFMVTLDRNHWRKPTGPIIKALRDAGASIESLEGVHLNSALAAAAFAGLKDAVQTLLDRGASPNAFCEHSFTTALAAAAVSGFPPAPQLVQMLLDKGADANAYFYKHRLCSSRLALDFPLTGLISGFHNSLLLDTWLESVCVLVSRGAIWDVNFAQWRECLQKKEADFERRNSARLDKLQLELGENRLKYFHDFPEAAFARHWRIKNIKDRRRPIKRTWRVMRDYFHFCNS